MIKDCYIALAYSILMLCMHNFSFSCNCQPFETASRNISTDSSLSRDVLGMILTHPCFFCLCFRQVVRDILLIDRYSQQVVLFKFITF